MRMTLKTKAISKERHPGWEEPKANRIKGGRTSRHSSRVHGDKRASEVKRAKE